MLTNPETDKLEKEEAELLEKYDRFMKDLEIRMSKDSKFCPIPGCSQILKRPTGTQLTTCDKCLKEICYTCQSAWHNGKFCKDYQEEIYLDFGLKTGAHRCPKCQVIIEKNKGCNHMKCYNCKYDFCWACGGSFTSDYMHSEFFFFVNCKRSAI